MTIKCDVTASFPTADQMAGLGRNHALIWAEICAIQQTILDGKCASGGANILPTDSNCILIDDGTPLTWQDKIESVDVIAPGQDYFPIPPTIEFATWDDAAPGSPALADFTVSAITGAITTIDVTNGGSGFFTEIATATVVPPAAGTTAEVALVIDPLLGTVTDVTITVAGSGYFEPSYPALTVVHPNGTGTGGSGTAVLTITAVDINGAITEITIDDAGDNYFDLPPQVTIVHPTGVGFIGQINANPTTGTIELGAAGVTIVAGGLGYQDALPTVLFTDPNSTGTGAETVVSVELSLGGVTAVEVTDGGNNFSAGTTSEIVPVTGSSGADAMLYTILSLNPYDLDVYDYYLALIGETSGCGIMDTIEQVVFYFTKLGYVIAPIPNEEQGAINWKVCWC